MRRQRLTCTGGGDAIAEPSRRVPDRPVRDDDDDDDLADEVSEVKRAVADLNAKMDRLIAERSR
ncbi:MAG: hypothetical protein ACRDY7_01985 [Acidimicrobiia bacterium]